MESFKQQENLEKWTWFAVLFVERVRVRGDDDRRMLAQVLRDLCARLYPLEGTSLEEELELAAIAFAAAERRYTWSDLTPSEYAVVAPRLPPTTAEASRATPGELAAPLAFILEFSRANQRPPAWFLPLQ